MIKEIDPEIGKIIENNGGYCCCAVTKSKDTKCPCKAFRDQEVGECECGRYEKILDADHRKQHGRTAPNRKRR